MERRYSEIISLTSSIAHPHTPLRSPAKNNPLPWTDHWLNSKSLQNAPQEVEIEQYLIGGIKQDMKKDTFSDFKL
jgi:ribonucleoside-diphosphate reductase beta chain